jgi:hypothetical protein
MTSVTSRRIFLVICAGGILGAPPAPGRPRQTGLLGSHDPLQMAGLRLARSYEARRGRRVSGPLSFLVTRRIRDGSSRNHGPGFDLRARPPLPRPEPAPRMAPKTTRCRQRTPPARDDTLMIGVGVCGIGADPTRLYAVFGMHVLNLNALRRDPQSGTRKLAGHRARVAAAARRLRPYLRTISTVSAVTPSDTATSFFMTPRVSCQTCSV